MKTTRNTSSGIFNQGRWQRGKRAVLAPSGIVLFIMILFGIIGSQKAFSQGVGISEVSISPDPSSILELRSTLRGLLAPRMTTAARTAIVSPAEGLLVYDTTTQSFWYFEGTWKTIASGTLGSGNQLLGMNAAGTANEYKTLAVTTNQINIAFTPGNIVLSLPQNINPGAAPTFAGLTVSGLTPNAGVYTDGTSALTSMPPTTGILGYWSRLGNVLSPTTAGDWVTTSGNIYTSGTGTVTSAGLLTGSAGETVSGGIINMNSSSNFATNINTGTSSGAVIIGNSANTITLPAFTAAGLVHNDATGVLSTGLLVNSDITNGTIDLTNKVTGILPVPNGGTGTNTLTDHGVLIGSGNSPVSTTATGTAGQVLQSQGNADPSYSTAVYPSTTIINQLLYSSSNNNITGLTTASGGVLNTSSSGVPSITATPTLGVAGTITGQLKLADGISSGNTITIQSAGTTIADYNFNLPTGAGTAGQPLLSGGGGAIAMTFGTLGVPAGGTGLTSGNSGGIPYFNSSTTMLSSALLTANGVVIGGGAGTAPSTLALGGANQLLGMNTGATANEYKTLYGTANRINVDLTIGGQITLSTPQNIDFGATPTFAGLTLSGLTPGNGVYTTTGGLLTTTPPNNGTLGFWNRNNVTSTLSPTTSGDAVTTSGNIYTSGTGTITSAGLLTGSAGATITGVTSISGGIISLNNNSNFATNINTGNSTGAITIGNSLNTITLPAFSTAGVVHNSAIGVLSTGLILNNDITNNTIDLPTKVTGVLKVSNGGTGTATAPTQGGIIFGLSTTAFGSTLAGSTGQVLQSNGSGTPTWSTPTYPSASGSVGKIIRSDGTNNIYSTSTFADTYAASSLLYSNGANTITGLATTNGGILNTNSSGVPSITITPTIGVLNTTKGTISLTGNASGIVTIQPQSAAGTYNFNLPTSAGTAGQPLLSGGGLAAPMTFGTLGVPGGGTGLTSGNSGGIPYFNSNTTMLSSALLTANGVVIGGGAGTAPFTLALGAMNQLLGMNTAGTANEYKTLSGTTNQINIAFTPGSIVLSTPQNIDPGATPTFAGLTVSGLNPNAGVYTNGTSTLTSTPPTIGILGYWSRSGNVLSPTTAGDWVTTSGNIYTSGTGTITSAGLLTGSTGATVSGGAINLNASSNNATNINTGTSTGAVTIGNSLSSLYLPKFTTAGILHNDATSLVTSSQVSLTGDVINILPVPNGGTGKSSITTNNLIYGNGAGAVNLLAPGVTTGALLMNTTAGAPSWSTLTTLPSTAGVLPIANGGTNSGTALSGESIMISNGSAVVQGEAGTTTTLLHGNASGAPVYGQLVNADITNSTIDLTQKVTGTLPISNGGTGSATQNFVDLTTNQTIGGIKTFTDAISASNLTGTNTGDVTLAGQDYLSIAGQVITANAVDLSGTNATGILAAARFPALTGDVTTTAGSVATTISPNAVTYGKMQNVSTTSKLLGSSSTTTPVQEITLGSGLTLSGTTLTASGLGGTVTSFSSGDLTPLFTTSVLNPTTTPALSFSFSNAGAYTLFGNNTGLAAAPAYFTPILASALFQNQGTTSTVLHGNASGNPSWGQILNADITNGTIDLTAKVVNVLPIANGGTNSGTALSGESIMVSNGSAVVQGDAGTTTTVLHGNAGGVPTYSQIVNADISNTAAIALSKLALGTNAQIIVGSATGVPTYVDATGDVTINNAGVTAIGAGKVTNSMLAGGIDLTTKVTGILPGSNGGTGVNNGTKLITVGGNFTTTPGNDLTLVTTGVTSVTMPLTGTLATLAGNENLTNKTINGLTPASLANGFSISGGTIPATLTVPSDATVTGSNSGDITIAGQNYLSLAGQVLTANAVDLSGTNATGILAAARFPALTGDVTTTAGSVATTISPNAVTYGKMQNVSTTSKLLGSSSTTTPVQEITLGSGLTLSGTTLTASGLGGTVTSFSSGDLTPLFTTSVLNPTTTPALSFSFSNAGAYTLFGNNTGLAAAPAYFTPILASALFQNQGTTSTVLHGNASGNPSWGQILNADITNGTIDLTAKVVNVLPIANGGTNSGTALSGESIMVSNGSAVVQGDAGTTTTVLHGNAGGVPTYSQIVNADISNTAAIALSKLALGTNAQIIVGSATGVPTYVDATGDVTINNAGVTAIGAGKVTNSMLAGGIDLTTKVTGILPGSNGGTGVNNGTKLITVGGNFTTTPGNDLTLVTTGVTSVTMPLTGTLATLAGNENLTNKTINGLTPASLANGFSISGGTIPATLTVPSDATVTGSNSGDITIAGQNYLSLAGQVLTANAVDLSGTNATGILAAARFPALTGDVTTTAGSVATTISPNAVTYGKMQNVSTTSKLLGSSSTTTPVQEITLGSGLTLSGTTLTASGLGGTVTSFSSGDLTPLFTTSVLNPTTTPALSFSFSNAGAYTLFGNNTGLAAAPAYFTPILASALFQNQGTTSTVLHGNASGNPSWGQILNADITDGTIDLTAKVTSVLPIANGGTNSGTALSGESIMVSNGSAVVQGDAGTTTTVLHGNAGGVPTYSQIVNADISNTAAIALSKLALGTNAQIIVGSATGVPTYVDATGDVTINNAGVTAIGAGKVTNSMLAGGIDLTTKVTGILPGSNGGTGVNNGTKLITVGGNFTTTPGNDLTLVTTGVTSVTMPLTGTLATLAGNENLTNKTINGLTPASLANGFSISGGTIPATLTVPSDATVTGSNSGDITIAGQNYLSLAGQVLTANAVDLSGTNATGILAAARFPALTGDVTTTAGSVATTISPNAVTYGKMQNVSTTSKLLGSSSTTTPVQEITLGSGLTLSGTTLTASGLGGTVTSFSSGDLTPLFTTSVLNPTTTPALSFSFSNAGAYTLFGNNTGLAAAPAYFTPILASALFQNQGTTSTVLHGNASGNPSWGQILNADITNGTIDLTAKVVNVLPIANGGTNSGTALSGESIMVSNGSAVVQGDAGTTTTVLHGNAGGVPTYSQIVNADISNTAAIALSKLALGTNAQIIVGSATGVPTYVDATGDVTINNAGVTAIGAGKVTNSMLAGGIDLTTKVTGILPGSNGGTGVNNGTKLITVGGNFTTTPGNDLTLVTTGVTSVTMPLTGTLATLAGNENLTNKTINGLTPASLANGFSISGGTIPATLTVPSDATVTGSNSGDITIAGQNYLSLAGQVLTANAVDLSGTNATGILAAARFPALTGDVTTTAGSVATTISPNAVTYGKMQNVSTTSKLLGSSSTTTPVQEITLGSGLTLSGTTLTASGLGGTVTSFSSGDLTPLFTTSVLNPTTTPALSFSFSNAGAYTLFGNNTGLAAAPAYFTPILASALYQNQGTTSTILHGNASGNPSWGQIVNADITNGTIDLTAKVVNVLPIANGGTNSGTALTGESIMVSNGSAVVQGDAGTTTTVLHGNAGGVPTYSQIVNADISNTAAIALSKLALGTNAQIIVGSATGVPTYVDATGDVTINNAGVTAIGAGKVTNSMLAGGIDLTTKVTGILPGSNGGTGVNNGTKLITVGGNFTTTPGNDLTLVTTGVTSVTMPLTGTLATLAGNENLTNKTINGLTPASLANGFSISGGTIPATLTVPSDATVTGSNSGDITIAGQNYLSLAGQVLTANAVDLSGTNATGILAAARFPALTGDVTTTAGSVATTISPNAVTYGKMQNVSTTSKLLGSSSTTTPVQEITLGSGLTLSGTTLTASGLGGTVTSFSSGDLTPLFTTSVLNPTTTPALSFSFSNAGAYTLFGNNTGLAAAPAYFTPILASALYQNQGTTSTILHGNASGNPSWGQIVNADITNGTIDLTAKVVNVLPIANGGTNSGTALTGESIMVSNGSAVVQGDAGTTTTVLHGNAGGVPTYSQIVNADISNTAAIALSKLALGTNAQIIVGSATGVPTYVDATGDVTINNAGVTAIGAGKVTNSMLAGGIDLTTKVTGILPGSNGGTGVNNGANTITLGGNISTGGTFTTTAGNNLTLTTSAATNVTLPTSGTLLTTTGNGSGLTGLTGSQIAGDISGNATNVNGIVAGLNGGTGVANMGRTITLGGNINTAGDFTTAGAFSTTLTSNAATNVTLPTSGTLYGTQTGSVTSLQLATTLTDETGTGSAVFANTPTLITPILGVAAATSINKLTITAPATSSTLTIADGKTFTSSNTLTLAGTDGSTLNIGTGGSLGTSAYTNSTAYEVPLTFSTGLTRTTNTITVNTIQDITKLSNLTSNGIVNTSGGDGTLGVTSTTGTGSVVLANSPALITPNIGAATASSINGNSITTGTGTLTLAAGKTLTANNTLTLAGTDGSTLNIGGGGTLGTNAFTSTTYAPIASPTFTGTVTIPTLDLSATTNQLIMQSAGVTGTLTWTPTTTAKVLTLPDATGTVALLSDITNGTATNFSGSLVGDVTGTQGATVVSTVGTSTAANVHLAELLANAATNLNTVSTIVKRDGSGNFSAGIISASLNGNANTVTTNANLTGPITSVGNATSIASQTGTGTKFVMDTSPTLITPVLGVASATSLTATGVVSGNQLTSTVAIGTAPLVVTSTTPVANLNIGGNAATVTTNANLTGMVTSVGNATTVVTNANLTGEVTSVGNATTMTNAAVIGKVLTGYVSGAGVITATDNILQAIQKLNGNNATNANLTGPITSVGNATSIASQTGTGTKFVMDTSPTLITPVLGVASATSLTATGVVSGNQLTSTVAIGTAPLVVTSTTPVANLNIGGNAATATLAAGVTTNANLTGPITSIGNATSIASQTGTGTKFVMDTSPTLITPALGVASATSLTATGVVSGNQLTSTVAIGTAPLVVTSTTPVANLNIGGNAATVTTNANLTGMVTSVGNATTVVTNANLTGEVTSVGNATTMTNAAVIGKVLTGYVSGAGVITATDNILQAIQKLNGNNATNANLTGPITSVGNATSIASQTGTGTKFVMDTSPTLITPVLGVASATSLTATGVVSGNQLTSTVAIGTAPLVVTSTTPVANLNIGGNAATATLAAGVTTNANLTGPITSIGNATSIASQTGTGTKFVMDTSPTLITPALGVASATSLTATGVISGNQLTSTIAIGTAPLVVTSTTPVANLNIGGNAANVTGTVAVLNGGTGLTTFGGTNTLLYTSTSNNLSSFATANNGILVTSAGGVPSIGNTIGAALSMPSINLSATSNQLVLQSAGVSGTLSWTPTASNKTITFPDASGTVALVSGGANWLVGGNVGGGGSVVFGTTDNTGINIQSGTGTINLGADAAAKTINIGNTTGSTAVNINTGTGASTFTTTGVGTLAIGGATSTGAITLGSSSNTQTVNIGTGTGANAVNIATAGTGNVTIGNATGTVTLPTLTVGSIPFAGTGGLISQNNTNLFWDNTDKWLGIGTAVPSAALTVVGDVNINATGSTTAAPRTIGIIPWGVNNAARYTFGDPWNALQNAYNDRMQLTAYHGVDISGNTQNNAAIPFVVGAATDASLNVIGTTAAAPILTVTSAASQTGNMQEWRNLGGTALAAISSTGGATINGAFNYGVDAGVVNAYAITLNPAPTVYVAGMIISFYANSSNTGACTININGLGPKSIRKRANIVLVANDILNGMVCLLIYDGTNFKIMNPIVP